MQLRNIEILSTDSNKKGDLFGRLMGDLFHSIGYDRPRLNIHKSGRELDLVSMHRVEDRMAIAECKAHEEKIGGADINKFIGALDAEKRRYKKAKNRENTSIVGYFISLSGFKETAIEQELAFDNARVILLKPEKIVDELIKGKVIVSIERAISSIPHADNCLTLVDYVDLLAYEKGWIWVVYFSDSGGQKVSHFTLVHAEGKPLINNLTTDIIRLDKENKNMFSDLLSANQTESSNDLIIKLSTAKERYFKYLKNELGEIQFEGLPTDKESGSVKVILENIFVSPHLFPINSGQQHDNYRELSKRTEIGIALKQSSRLAILAKPGSGKSTLIKRIAIAYAFPQRRELVEDNLPDEPWFPIFIRCRELGNNVNLSITEIINNIPNRAEIQSSSNEFSILVSESLQKGTAILLIDGLDEITEDKSRVSFVNQLRTFLATYPTINLIVTSREAGFRIVGGILASYCDHYAISSLDSREIHELSLKWHNSIIDDSQSTRLEAERVTQVILNDSRIRALAENPLLLTTLLFVKRWAGYLPTKRSLLYQEMIKLLLVTWNVEGHEQLEMEETEPQLAYVAYWMTDQGYQTINETDLKKCLISARKQMPEILGYTKTSPSEFIRLVESRSSLLILSGHKKTDSGEVIAVYEFLHLSFQEYLTAKALVKKYLPESESQSSAFDVIKSKLGNESWNEVIPLAAVLLERDARDLVEYLVNKLKNIQRVDDESKKKEKPSYATNLLGNFLANEIQINPVLLDDAIEWFVKNIEVDDDDELIKTIIRGKFGKAFDKKVKDLYFSKFEDQYAVNLGAIFSFIFFFENEKLDAEMDIFRSILSALKGRVFEEKCFALFALMHAIYDLDDAHMSSRKDSSTIEEIFDITLSLFPEQRIEFMFPAFWSIAWAGEKGIFPKKLRTLAIESIIPFWVSDAGKNFKQVISWALLGLLSPSLNANSFGHFDNLTSIITQHYDTPESPYDKITAIYMGWIIGMAWDVSELTTFLNSEDANLPSNFNEFVSYASTKGVKISVAEH